MAVRVLARRNLIVLFLVAVAGLSAAAASSYLLLLGDRQLVNPVRRAVETALARQTGLKVSLGELRPAPFGSLVLLGLTAREPSGTTLLTAERLTVHLNPLAWLRSRRASSLVGEVELVRPRLDLTRETDGTWSVSRYLRPGKGGGGWDGRLVLRDGEVAVKGWRPEMLSRPDAAGPSDAGFRLTGVTGELTSTRSGAVQFRLTGRADLLPGARLTVKGDFGRTSGGQLEVGLTGVDLAAAQQRLLPEAQPHTAAYGRLLGGEGNLTATLSIIGSRPRLVSAELSLHGATWQHPSLDAPLSAVVGRIGWRGDRLSVSQFSFSFLETRWAAEGSIRNLADPVLDLKISGENASLPALSRALPESLRRGGNLSGLVSLDLAARGEWRNPVVTGFVRLSGVSLPSSTAGFPVSDLTGTLELAGDGVRTRQLTARSLGGQVTLSGEVRDWRRPHGSLEVKLGGIPVEELRRLVPPSLDDRLRPLTEGKLSGTLNLEGPLAEPAVQGRLSLVGARWGSLPVESAELDGAYAGGRVNLERVLVVAAGGRLEATATAWELSSAAPRFSFSGSLTEMDAAALAAAVGWSLPVAVEGRVSALLAGQGEGFDWRNLSASGTVSLADGRVGEERLSAARAGVSFEQGEVAVDYLSVSSPDGEVTGYARQSSDGRLSGVLSGQRLQLAAVSRYVKGLPLDGTANLLAELGGTLSAPELSGEFDLTNPAFRGETFAHGRGRFQLSRRQLTLESLSVTRPDGSFTGSGTLGLDPTHPLDLNLTVSSLPAATLLAVGGAQADVSGTVSGRVTLTGPARSVVATGEALLTGGRVAGYPLARGAAEFRYAGQTLELMNLSAESDGVTASGRGTIVGDVLDLTFSADRLDLSKLPLLPGAGEGAWQGTASFQGRLRGSVHSPTLDGELSSAGVTYRGYHVESAAGHLRYQDGKVTLEDVAVARGKSSYLISGDVQPGRSELDLRLRFDRADLTDLLTLSKTRLPFEFRGQTTGVLHVWGSLKNPSARLIADLDETQVSGMRLAGDLDLALRDGEVTVNRIRLGEVEGDGLIVALGRVGKSGIDLQARARRVDLRPFTALFKGEPPAVTGRADADLTVTGALDDPEATLTVSVAEAKVNGMDLSALHGRATYARGSVRLDEVVLTSGDQRLTASGVLPIPAERLRPLRLKGEEREWDLSVAMPHGDLGLLSFVVPGLRLAGPGSLSLRLTGPAAAPRVAGEVVANGVSVKHPSLNGEITGVTGRIDLDQDGIRTRNLKGRYNGGETHLTGSATLAGLRLGSLDLTLSGRDVHYQTPVFDATLDADLTVRGPLADAVISGRGVLNRSTLTLGAPSRRSAPKWNPHLDVTVTTREDLRLVTTTRLVDARAYGSLTIRGRLAAPTFTGEAEASRGTIVYLNTPFRVTRGQAVFSAYRGILPTLDVTAETTLDGTAAGAGELGSDIATGTGKLKVQLAVTGPVERLTLSLSSDPPLSQADITAALSLPGDINRIILGGDQASGDRSAELLRVAGQQISNQLFSGLEVAVADALQLDELTLVPGYREQNVQLHVGKYLVDKVYLTYNRTMDLQPYESLGLEYRILNGLTLTTSYDTKGEFKWALEARHRF